MSDNSNEGGDKEAGLARRKFERSPGYPYIDIRTAIERARKFWEREKRNSAPVSSAVHHWGFAEKSSGGRLTVAALLKFGLLQEEGRGEDRQVRLTRLALDILLDEQPDSADRDEAIRKAALMPDIHAELWRKYGPDLPSHASLRTYLVRDRGFTEAAVDDLIKEYRETIDFARLKAGGAGSGEGRRQQAGHLGDVAHPPTEHTAAGRQPGASSRLPAPSVPPVGADEPLRPGIFEDRLTLDEGTVTVRWPSDLSRDSFDDFEYFLKGIINRARRKAGAKPDANKPADGESSS